MVWLIFSFIFLLTAPFQGEEIESDFAKKELFSLFGYNPLMGGDEKELRNLHNTAEAHMRKKEYLQAEKAYEEILQRIDPPYLSTNRYKVDWPTYIDLVLRLSDVKLALKEHAAGQKLLTNLQKTHPPSEYLPSINFHLARFYVNQNEAGEAYTKMRESIAHLPLEKWRGEDRSFFHGIEFLLNNHYDKLIQKANRFAAAQNTKDAITMYEEIMRAIGRGHYPKALLEDSIHQKKVRYKLAELYYQEAKFEKTLSLITEVKQPKDTIDTEMLYLAANAYKERREFEKSIECFLKMLESKQKACPQHLEHALFELGVADYNGGRFESAKTRLAHCLKGDGKILHLAHLYLAKIAIKNGDAQSAKGFLEPLAKMILNDDPLKYEISYLRGQIALIHEDYSLAIEFFENAIPTFQTQREWVSNALYQLGVCYLKLSEVAASGQKKLEEKAEKIFENLLLNSPNESIILSLAKLYFSQNKIAKMEEILQKESSYFTREGEVRALLLLAEGKKEPLEKEKILIEATDERFAGTSSYPECWFKRATLCFSQGLFTESAHSFEKAFSLYEKNNLEMAKRSLECAATANCYRNLPLDALTNLEKLLANPLTTSSDREEIIYLRGLLCSHLACERSDLSEADLEKYRKIAFEVLQEIGMKKGENKWKTSALLALGSLHFRQKNYAEAIEIFQQLEEQESSPACSSALFWHAEALQKLEKNSTAPLALRKKCFQKFPFSTSAPLAYFKCYPFEKYLENESEAISHIKMFPTLFPNSPLQTLAYYFIGKNESDRDLAAAAFEKAIWTFDQTFEKAKDNKILLEYFRARAIFEFSSMLMNEKSSFSDLMKTVSLLENCSRVLEKNETLKQMLGQECQFLLAKSYLQTDQEKKGSEILFHLLDEYKRAGIKEDRFLAATMIEQAKLAMQHNDIQAASLCLEMAEACGQNHLPLCEKLHLWILQSQLLKRENKLDSAMRMLSKVINTDVSSSLRDQAMFLRAEIYELEGRCELAIKQLESSAKRGGRWGEAAKEKLRVDYGL